MKRLLIILAAIAATFSLRAAETEFVFTDATTLKVCGKFCDDTFDEFSRMPGKYKDIFTTPTKTQRLVFDLLGIKYVYKGEPQNDDLTPPEEL